MRVHGINSYLKWTNNVLRKKKKENRYRNFLKIGISTMEFVSSFSVARSANNVGKFRERVSNRFGTEDDDRGSLSPVSLATCKPNCVTWSGTETCTKLGNERSGRRYSAYSSAFCGRPTLQRSDVRLPFLKSSPGIRLHRRGYRAPCYAIGPRRDASNTASRLLNVTDVHILSRSLASPLFANRTVTCARIRRVLYVTKSLANTQRRVDFPFRIV